MLLVVNATQSFGALSMDVRAGVDMLYATGLKWLSSGYGAGFLYLNQSLVDDLGLADSGPGPEAMAASAERAQSIQAAVLALPEASRAVLVLREYEGFSYQQIAEALDIPLGTVMSRLNYARKLLKEKLEMQILLYAEAENV